MSYLEKIDREISGAHCMSYQLSRVRLAIKPHGALPQMARFMGPTWDPPGSCRPQVGAMLAPKTLLSGIKVLRFPHHWPLWRGIHGHQWTLKGLFGQIWINESWFVIVSSPHKSRIMRADDSSLFDISCYTYSKFCINQTLFTEGAPWRFICDILGYITLAARSYNARQEPYQL